jgi:NAD(P)H-flavin reductase
MSYYNGQVLEIQLEVYKNYRALIHCSTGAVPAPGQYLLAHNPKDYRAPIALPIFPATAVPRGMKNDITSFLTAPPIPEAWPPGTNLILQGPYGHGFTVPQHIQKLALIALGKTASRLFPIADLAMQSGAEVALFCDEILPYLPSVIEANPLSALAVGLTWADFIAIDSPKEMIPGLRSSLRHGEDTELHCPAQILVHTSMPCGGSGECAVCAIPVKGRWKFTCKDGPVFNLRDLDW